MPLIGRYLNGTNRCFFGLISEISREARESDSGLNRPGFDRDPDLLVVLFRPVVRMLPLTREECGLMPRQYSSQFRERVVALAQDRRDVRDLANELGIAAATIYRWQRQARIGAGEIVGINNAIASELTDAKRRIRDLGEELTATRLAASLLKDVGIPPKGGSRSFKP